MNSERRKTADPHRLLPNISGKPDLKRSDKYVALSNITIYYTWKHEKIQISHTKAINLKYLGQRRIKIFNYLIGQILY